MLPVMVLYCEREREAGYQVPHDRQRLCRWTEKDCMSLLAHEPTALLLNQLESFTRYG